MHIFKLAVVVQRVLGTRMSVCGLVMDVNTTIVGSIPGSDAALYQACCLNEVDAKAAHTASSKPSVERP